MSGTPPRSAMRCRICAGAPRRYVLAFPVTQAALALQASPVATRGPNQHATLRSVKVSFCHPGGADNPGMQFKPTGKPPSVAARGSDLAEHAGLCLERTGMHLKLSRSRACCS
jgi:hypothetical protein